MKTALWSNKQHKDMLKSEWEWRRGWNGRRVCKDEGQGEVLGRGNKIKKEKERKSSPKSRMGESWVLERYSVRRGLDQKKAIFSHKAQKIRHKGRRLYGTAERRWRKSEVGKRTQTLICKYSQKEGETLVSLICTWAKLSIRAMCTSTLTHQPTLTPAHTYTCIHTHM